MKMYMAEAEVVDTIILRIKACIDAANNTRSKERRSISIREAEGWTNKLEKLLKDPVREEISEMIESHEEQSHE